MGRKANVPRTATPALSLPAALLVWAALIGAVLVTRAAMTPPSPIPSNANFGEFSAERAMRHVRAIAREPHPPGSAAHDRARDYVAAQFRALGYDTRVHKTVVRRDLDDYVKAATVENVIAMPPGGGGRRVLLLTAHYDSVPTGPGAGDDAGGVATLLETARALRDAPPPANADRPDIAFLVTDGEETGLLGATAFVQDAPTFAGGRFDPKRRDVIVLNFEARGGSGPVFMFETSDGNDGLISALSHAPRPLASGLMYALYKILPNDTDLTVFKGAGMRGLNFAFADQWSHYHTALDTPDDLSPASIQHHGSYALSLCRRLSAYWPERTGKDALYFDLFSRVLVRYPAAFVWPLTALGLIVFAVAAYRVRRDAGSGKSFLAGFLLFPFTLVVSGVTATAFTWAITPLRNGSPYGDTYAPRPFEAALFAFALAASFALWLSALRRFPARSLCVGALLWWVAALIAASVWLPGATYLFLWPLLFALVPVCLSRQSPALSAFFALPAIVFFVPVLHSLTVLIGFGMPAALGGMCAFAVAPQLPAVRGTERLALWPVVFLAGVGTVCCAIGVASSHGPKRNSLIFVQDTDRNLALFATPNRSSDTWLHPFVGEAKTPLPNHWRIPWDRSRYAFRSAAPLNLPAVRVARSGDTLTVRPSRRSQEILLYTNVPIRGATFQSRPLKLYDGRLRFRYLNPQPEGLSLTLNADRDTMIVVMESENRLPALVPPRPPGFISTPNLPYPDATLTRHDLFWR